MPDMKDKTTPVITEGPVVCLWTEDDEGTWSTTCGISEWAFEDGEGTPRANKMRFCPFCGKPLRQRSYRGR